VSWRRWWKQQLGTIRRAQADAWFCLFDATQELLHAIGHHEIFVGKAADWLRVAVCSSQQTYTKPIQ
jgi:hypothetical protein